MKALMSVDQISTILGVARTTIYEWCSERQIPFLKIGSRTMFDPEEIGRWLDMRRKAETPDTLDEGQARSQYADEEEVR
jgi:excisionase family DNA binding protein